MNGYKMKYCAINITLSKIPDAFRGFVQDCGMFHLNKVGGYYTRMNTACYQTDDELDVIIGSQLEQITQYGDFFREFTKNGGLICLYCTLTNNENTNGTVSMTLSPKTLSIMSAYGVKVEVDG